MHSPSKIIARVLLPLLLLVGPVGAQQMPRLEYLPLRIGLTGSLDNSWHTAGFGALPGVPACCPSHTGGDGSGFSAGGFLTIPLSSTFFVQLRAGYGVDDALLGADEWSVFNLDGEAVPAVIRHEIAARESFVAVEPRLGVHLWQGLHLLGGIWAGVVGTDSYTQVERLIEPSRGTFNNGSRERNRRSGAIPDAGRIAVSAVGGLGWDLPLTRGGLLMLTPALTWRQQLTRIVSGVDWRRGTLTAELALSLALGGPSPLPRPTGPVDVRPDQRPDPVATPSASPLLTASLGVTALGAEGMSPAVTAMRVEEFVTFEMQPLLNYVFFDEGSSTLPSRYAVMTRGQTQDFTLNALQGGRVLDTYHQLLNIVGHRLMRTPSARLTVVGCNAGQAGDAGGLTLSRDRASTVAGYLTDVWGIDPGRISIEARNLPEKPTTNLEGDGQAENRRVELTSTDESILAPIMLSDTSQLPDPPGLVFSPRVQFTVPIAGWRLAVTDGSTLIREFSGEGTPPGEIPWTVVEDWSDAFRSASRLLCTLTVESTDGTRASAATAVRTELVTIEKKRAQRTADVEIDLYNLILFDFGSTMLGDANRRIVSFIRGRIKPGARVSVTGYTDRIGDARFNQKLSRDRAQATADELGVPGTTVTGIGEVDVHPNRLPEGRFYNRTVSVKVETPVQP